ISAYQKCVAETVQHFGGFVAKYMGDSVLIYFAYPQAHEDDAERAVRAGLELVAAVGGLKTHTPLQWRRATAKPPSPLSKRRSRCRMDCRAPSRNSGIIRCGKRSQPPCYRPGRLDEAEAQFKRALERTPNNGWSYYGLSRVYAAQGNAAAAKQAEEN